MAEITLTRGHSTMLAQGYPTQAYGLNPPTLQLGQVASKAVYSLLKFAIPGVILAPTTYVASAKLRINNKGPIAHSHTIQSRRTTAAWAPATVHWANKPAVAATVGTATKASAADGEWWEIDVTADIVAMQTAKNHGWELRITGATADGHAFRNTGSYVATLEIEYHVVPAKPTSLSPSGASNVVSVPKPVVRVVSPAAEHTALAIQISSTQNGVTPDFEVEHNDAGTFEIDLDDYVGAPSLSSGQTTYYRIKFIGTGGTESTWSDWQSYKYVPFGSFTLDTPGIAPADIIYGSAPEFEWTHANQIAYRFFVEDPSLLTGQDVIYDSGVLSGTAQAATATDSILTEHGHVYRVRLRVWDNQPRIIVGGVPAYQEIVRDFTFELDPAITPADTLTLVDEDPLPFVTLTWERASVPDFYQILRDGVQVAYVTGVDVLLSGTSYAWTDLTASPRRAHTWTVRAVDDGHTSAVNPTGTTTINPSGLWLSQPEESRFLPIITQEAQSVGLSEDGETFTPLNSDYAVRISGAKRNYSGTITGEILATELTDTATGASLRDTFLLMRKAKATPMYLTLLDRNLKVIPFNMTIAPTPTPGRNEDYVYAMSFDFIEVP